MRKFTLLCAASALAIPAAAFAQSTGTTEMENQTITVTGTRTKGVGGVEVPPTTKTREVLNSDFIQRQVPGQSVNEVIINEDVIEKHGSPLITYSKDSKVAEG